MPIVKVRELTVVQKDLLVGQIYFQGMFFNPVLDADGKWFISNKEIDQCDKPEFSSWIGSLPEINHNPIILEI